MLISIRIENFTCIWCSPFIYVNLYTYPLLQCLDLRESQVSVFAMLPFEFFSLCRTACMYICNPSEQPWCECKSQWKRCEDKHQWAGSPGYMNCAWMDFRKDFSCWWLSGFQRKHWNEETWLQGQVKTGQKWEDVLCAETAAEVNSSSLSGCSDADLRSVLTELAFKQSLKGRWWF